MDNELQIELDERDESWLNGGQVAVPLEITARGNTVSVCYYPSAKQVVFEFLQCFGKDEATLFSKGALLWATKKLGAFLGARGFDLSPDSCEYYVNFRLEGPCDNTVPEVRRIVGDEGYEDLTETDIDGLLCEGYIIYAAVVDNKIVALANTGEPICNDTAREVEIGVDTAEAYRRRGFGRACVAALVGELWRLGHTAIYECSSGNTASICLAESLGGRVAYKKIYIVGFEK